MGWRHIKASSSTYNNAYSRTSRQGVSNSYALGYSRTQPDGVMDLLVTPVVYDSLTMYVKRYGTSSSYTSNLEFYKVTETDGTLTIGDKIDVTLPTLTSTMQQFKVPVSSTGERIGIRMSYVYIDNLASPKATYNTVYGMQITSVSWNQSQAGYSNSQALVDEEDSIKAAYNVSIRNTGDFALSSGLENYSITLYDPENDNAVVATVPITKATSLNGTSSSNIVSGKVSYANHKNPFRLYFRENLSGTEFEYSSSARNSSTPLITPVPHEPLMYVNRAYSDTLKNGQTITFPTNSTANNLKRDANANPTTKTYTIYNTGGSTLRLSNVTVSDGFTVSAPDTVAALKNASMVIGIDKTTAGNKKGTLSFTTNEAGNPTYTYNLEGLIVDSTAFWEGVLTYVYQTVPDGFVNENTHWTENGNHMNLMPENEGNSYGISTQTLYSTEGKLITPLLNVDSRGIEFLAAPYNYDYTTGEAHVTVYYSTDRKTWTALKTYSSADGSLPVNPVTPPRSSVKYSYTHFSITDIPAGHYYIGFDGANVMIDDIICEGGRVELAHDVLLVSQSLPTSGKVNRESDANIEVRNTLNQTERNATIKFVVGDKVVETRTDSISGNTTEKYYFTYYPDQAGTFKTYIAIDFGDGYTVSTDTVDLVVSAEDGNRTVAFADLKTTDNYAPVTVSQMVSESEVIYSPDQIGIAKGDVIKGITFKGAMGGASSWVFSFDDFKENVRVWVNVVDSDKVLTAGSALPDTLAMKKVYDGQQTITKAGTLTNSYVVVESADVLKFMFDEPIVYNGGYLDFVFKAAIDSISYAPAQAYYISDKTDKDHAMSRATSTEAYLSTSRFTVRSLPVAYFEVESKVDTISGTITDRKNNSALDSVVVTLTHGGIVYTDTTDTEGKYSIPIYETNYDYEVAVARDGYYPVYETLTINADTVRNYQLNPSGTLYMESSSIPTTGMVNHKITAKAVGVNFNAEPQADYTAKFYVAGEAVAEGTPHDTIATQAKSEFTFQFTPHTAGTFPAYIEFATGESTYTSDTVQIVVSAESLSGTVQVGDSTYMNNGSVPASMVNKNTQSEVIYTADQIGLAAGTSITKLYYKSYCNTNKTINSHIIVWMENVDDGTIITSTNATARDTAQMTKVWEGDKVFETKHGSQAQPDSLFTFTLPQAFQYGGQNLRIVVHTYSDNFQGAFYFMSDSRSTNKSLYRTNDNVSTMLSRSFSVFNYIPVAFLEYSSPKMYGVVRTADSTAVAGATVKLQSDEVVYTGTTAEDGTYSIDVAQGALTYLATASAEGYLTDSIYDVDFPAGNVEMDFTLREIPVLSGAVVSGTDSIVGAVVTLSRGDVVLTDTTDAHGIYSIQVAQPELTYTANVSADGYLPGEFNGIKVEQSATRDFELKAIPVLSGAVTDGVDSIAGATVTLRSDTVVYTATTDAHGIYSISVPQIELTYSATVAADGYLPTAEDSITVSEDTKKDFVLRKVPVLKGIVSNIDDQTAIGGATVTLKSDTVVYTATTDAEGAYTISIATLPEANLTYEATFAADGYLASTVAGIAMADGDTTVNVALQPTTVSVTVPASGWTTFSYRTALEMAEGVKAHIVVNMSESYVQTEQITGTTLNATEGYLLEATPGTYTFTVVADANATATTSLLVGTPDSAYTVTSAEVGKVLTFTQKDGDNGFQKAAEGTVVAKNHAYLRVKDGLANVGDFLKAGTDDVTAIRGINAIGLDETKPMYNLQGTRVQKSYRGVVIQNGKKYIKK